MKRILSLIAVSFVMSAGMSFATGAWVTPSGDGTINIKAESIGAGLVYSGKLSANVRYSYEAATDGSAYVVGTMHTSGTKSYATASSESRIFMVENTVQSEATVPPTYATTLDWASWTALK